MSHSSPQTCPRCQAAIPAGVEDQLCPACLMSQAMGPADDETFTEVLGGAPKAPQVSQLSHEFPRELGSYRLLGVLGAGGMGTVYEAEHLDSGRRVALKVLARQLDSPEMRQRFLREGRLAGSVNHPNSLYVFGCEEIDQSPVITMEIAGGGTLKDRLAKRGAFPVTEAVDAILEVIAGLEAAHEGGVLHRDVKPSNCFVTQDGSIKVGDFGLSVSTMPTKDTYITKTGAVMGTPAYAPPEQLRGDRLDLRADIYSVGATLYTLLTGRAPFEGDNAVQVVANAVNQPPKPLGELREGVPEGLERIINRCLAKDPSARYPDYKSLREALLRFSSLEPEPASMCVRSSAGHIDYLIALLVPYVPLMLYAGGEAFHMQWILDRSFYSARFYLVCMATAILYFTISEGIFGAGVGKRAKGLRVVRSGGRRPGLFRAMLRIVVPLGIVEGVRLPIVMGFIKSTEMNAVTGTELLVFFIASFGCPWVIALPGMLARESNGHATLWDLVSGTRVVVEPKGNERPPVPATLRVQAAAEDASLAGPFRIVSELVQGEWLIAFDPVLRRQVWLLRRGTVEPSAARKDVARPGRLRWLQAVGIDGRVFDAYQGMEGTPLLSLSAGDQRPAWNALRYWLHDLATELWSASRDATLPGRLGLDQVWITGNGRAVLLDQPWPEARSNAPTLEGKSADEQQQFLSQVADLAEQHSLPLHARPVLESLAHARFEKMSYTAGNLLSLLDKPAGITPMVRGLSIFMFPVYISLMLFVGMFQGAHWVYRFIGNAPASIAVFAATLVLAGSALFQLFTLPFGTLTGLAVFRLAIADESGNPAGLLRLLQRWAITWVPLLGYLSLVAALADGHTGAILWALLLPVVLWTAAGLYASWHPRRGLQDRWARTWIVRR